MNLKYSDIFFCLYVTEEEVGLDKIWIWNYFYNAMLCSTPEPTVFYLVWNDLCLEFNALNLRVIEE